MATNDQLLKRLEDIEDVLNSGESASRYADRGVNFRSLAELRSIRDDLRRQLGMAQAKPRIRYGEFRDGSGASSGGVC
jgi:hypothetical protein